MSNRYGLTEREKAIWPPKKEMDWSEFWMYLVLIVALFAVSLGLHHFVEPQIPTAHANTKTLSDKDQEALYCAQLATGEKKLTNEVPKSAITEHCKRFL